MNYIERFGYDENRLWECVNDVIIFSPITDNPYILTWVGFDYCKNSFHVLVSNSLREWDWDNFFEIIPDNMEIIGEVDKTSVPDVELEKLFRWITENRSLLDKVSKKEIVGASGFLENMILI